MSLIYIMMLCIIYYNTCIFNSVLYTIMCMISINNNTLGDPCTPFAITIQENDIRGIIDSQLSFVHHITQHINKNVTRFERPQL